MPDARYGLERVYPLEVFLFSAKLNDIVSEPLSLRTQIVEKSDKGFKGFMELIHRQDQTHEAT